MPVEPLKIIDLIYKYARLEGMQLPHLTRLVKLIYLAEWEYFRLKHARLTGLDWKFHQYGPYPPALKTIIGESEIVESAWTAGRTSQQIVRDEAEFLNATGEPDLERLISRIVKDWGDADLNLLLDHVYFETEPMQAARRGDLLDFSTAKPPREKIRFKLDQKRLSELRSRLRQRATSYAQLRQSSEPEAGLIQGLQIWDDASQPQFPSGQCFVDVSGLVPKNE